MAAKEHLMATVSAPGSRPGGGQANDIITGTGGKQILIDDPSGNPVELFQPILTEAALSPPRT